MERDFLGLSFKESAVKEETVSDVLKDSAPGAQWPFANKVSSLPHFMRHQSDLESSANKTAANPFASSNLAQNLAGSITKQFYCKNTSIGSTAQMTIFYNGTVNVFDSITPEKAQAIMFLAGNGSCLVTNTKAQVMPPIPKLDATDALPTNQLTNAQLLSTISSSVSVSSHNGTQSASGSICTDDNKATVTPFALDSKMNPPKPINALGLAVTTSMIPRGIPQSRKVSLARFLEKRKERAMNAAPYNGAKKPECAT